MRYIVNSANYVLAVSFGSAIRYSDKDCIEYTGRIPSGWNSLEEWHEDEGNKLWRWKIVNGNLTLDSSAVAPEEGRWGAAKLQDKSVTGLILEDMTVTPDEDYDGLSSVIIPSQPCWKFVEESKCTILENGKFLYIPDAIIDGKFPKAIILDFADDNVNVLSEHNILLGLFQLTYRVLTSCKVVSSYGNGLFYTSLYPSSFNVSESGNALVISRADMLSAFYYNTYNPQPLYRVHLMY